MFKLLALIIFLTGIIPIYAQDVYDKYGAVVRRGNVGKTIYLIFSADSTFEGAPLALDIMNKRNIKASFFFTGRFLRMAQHQKILQQIIAEGHYIGGHSDGHLLYADWDENRSTLVTPDSLVADLRLNYRELAKYGIDQSSAPYYLPPYEWYNAENVTAISSLSLQTINFTPGQWLSDDYTTPDMGKKYRTCDWLQKQLYEFEREQSLDGALLLMHLGTHPARSDKLYLRLGEIIDYLASIGYKFSRL